MLIPFKPIALVDHDDRAKMKNFKASAHIIATTLLVISCQAVNGLTNQEILNNLLQADMAMQRDMPELALEKYMLVAKDTKDPEVAQLATELAIQLQDTNQAIASAEIWAQAAPNDLQAQLLAVSLYVNTDSEKTENFLTQALNPNDNTNVDQHLLLIMSQLSPTGQKNLTDAVYNVANANKTNAEAQLAAAQLAAVQMNIDSATTRVQLALQLNPELTSAIELNAKLIRHKKNSDKPALAYLAEQVNKYPKNGELRQFYITALLDNNQESQAIPQLETLSKDSKFGGDALITLGEIYITQKNYKLAASVINKSLNYEDSADKANFYLGQLAEINKNNLEAINFYENVGETSEYHIPAFLRAAYLYSSVGEHSKALSTLQNSTPTSFEDQKQLLLTEIDVLIDSNDYEQALERSNIILNIVPDDTDFLYARSVVYSLLHKNPEAETDLRAILNLDPENINALNALGFILSNQPARVQEAMPLLQKALSLNPDNPVIMDSMGWLLYKMGKNKDALSMLARAYKLSNDTEIAAHYGEVLWANGKKQHAIAVWNKALVTSPDDEKIIHDTLAKLNISITALQTKHKAGN